MPCFCPIQAYKPDDGGSLVFTERAGYRPLQISCGQCVGCRLERSRQWAVRCMHESQMHEFSSFVTLTYDDEHCPVDYSLRYRDFQLFMKRLRRRYSMRQRIRFFMCGEYGDNFQRPHFHACLFGVFFEDREVYRDLPSGSRLYTSKILESLWTSGFSSVGDVTFESAAYVARYVMKKVTGNMADEHYKSVDLDTGEVFWRVPEFTHMSLKPGIGYTWFEKYKSEVFPRDEVICRGKKMKPPKYYTELLRNESSLMIDDVEYERYKKMLELSDDSPERLATREICAKARLKLKVRSLV